MKNRWLKLTCAGLALLMLSLTALACPAPDNGKVTTPGVTTNSNGSTQVPEISFQRVAPNNLDLAGRTKVDLAMPGEGALLVNENIRLWVPPGAVAEPTPVTITACTEDPGALTSTKADAPEVTVISNYFDLGPDNTKFDKPVKITIPYSEEDLPAGTDENQIGPIYFDGANWVPMERELDTVNNIVSFETRSFPGVFVALAFGIQLGWPAVVGVGAVITGTAAYIGYTTYKYIVKDPAYWGKAAQYVTPNDPVVQKYAAMSKVKLMASDTKLDIKDLLNNPQAISKIEGAVDSDGYAGFIQFFNNSVEEKMDYQVSWNPNDWQKPTDFFSNGMRGDCKNVANAMASIFRGYGFAAKCVDGYTEGKRHAWVEVKIGETMYYVGSRGELMTLDGAIKYHVLTRPQNKDGEGFTWDENGQKPYKEKWWLQLQVTVDESKAYPGGQVIVNVLGTTGYALNFELTVEGPNEASTKYTGTTDATGAPFRLTLPLKVDALPGVYTATAVNAADKVTGVGVFYVNLPVISAYPDSAEYAPGEKININTQIYPAIATGIEIERVNGKWTTGADGSAIITLLVPENAKPGLYTLIVKAPLLGLTTKVTYTVVLPPSLKVDIMPKEVKPGDIFIANVIVQPPVVTKITVKGYDGRWMTDKDGFAFPTLPVSKVAAPGVYELVVEAPDLGLSGSATYTVTLAPTPQVNTAINVVAAELDITVDGSNDTGDYEAKLLIGGEYVRGTLENNEVHADGRVYTNSGDADMHYDFVLNKDLSQVISGSVSLIVDNGEAYYFELRNLPRNTDYEAKIKQEQGLDVMAYILSGAAVSGHFSSVSIQSSELGSVTSCFAADDSELIVVLVAATKDQLDAIFSE
jgi:hypothetical protein